MTDVADYFAQQFGGAVIHRAEKPGGRKRRLPMRPILFGAAAMSAASVLAGCDATAQYNRWCSRGAGADNCGFVRYEQCRANISGIGGKCVPDARAAVTYRARTAQPRGS
jgi:Protein of unknown function (DUF3551)